MFILDILDGTATKKYIQEQKRLKELSKNQSYVCECGWPITPPPEIYLESFFGFIRVYKSYNVVCGKCGKDYTIAG